MPYSTINFIEGKTIGTMSCFATKQGTDVEIASMKAFRRRFPQAPIPKLINTIDAGVQQRKHNLVLDGYMLDAAIYEARRCARTRACGPML